jgi:hypothetical protein
MLLFSPRWLFLYPGALLMVAGLAGMATLLPGPLAIGRVVFDIHTLLFAALATLLGFQALSFAALAKFFAIRTGLQRPAERFDDWFRRFTLESGLVLGGILLLTGFFLWGGAFWIWGGRGFGTLNPVQTLRWVIPGALSLMLGGQLLLTSFFLGVLRLDTRPGPE